MPAQQIIFWVAGGCLVTLWAFMQWNHKLPTVQSVQDLATAVNSRGGNILVLGGFSLFFFVAALRFTYWVISRESDGKVTVESSVAMAAFTWMTGSAFGGAFTSMVKAMTGESSKARSSDGNGNGNGNGNGDHVPALVTATTNVSSTTTTTTVPPPTSIQTGETTHG